MIEIAVQRYALLALLAAALFGASTPIAKLLLSDASPQLLAGLLYLGSGVGLGVFRVARSMAAAGRVAAAREAALPLGRADLPWLAASIVSGGVVAPVLLLWGLDGIGAAPASLLLNAEAVLTAMMAAAIFSEHVGARVWWAAALACAAGGLLAWEPGAQAAISPHAVAVLAACIAWGLDNNFTRKIAAGDAVNIALLKGLAAGSVNLGLALAAGARLPAPAILSGALLLGAFSYGASLALYVVALRHLGSARTGAHFASAPFIGVLVALAMGEAATPMLWVALLLMALAIWLVLNERHAHAHLHEELEHSHLHRHDEHHRHTHPQDAHPQDGHRVDEPGAADAPHAHRHVHAPQAHSHPHLPDLHHRHRHRH